MTTENPNPYEGMFLFPQTAATNLQAAVDHVKMLLDRAGAQIISMRKWDERRLAYEIKGNKRGVYFLVYFRVAGSKLAFLERDCNLSEELLRVMITRADHIPLEQMEAVDGQAELADEIRLRRETPPTPTSHAGVVEQEADRGADSASEQGRPEPVAAPASTGDEPKGGPEA